MRGDHHLRLYINPVRFLLLLVLCGALTVLGVWMLRNVGDVPLAGVIAWTWLGFSGLGIAFTLPELVWASILRHPILQIDEQRWSSRSWLFLGKRTAMWQDIEYIGLHRYPVVLYGTARTVSSVYYLVVHAKDPATAVRVRVDPVTTRLPPSVQGARMAVRLNELYLNITPEKVEDVLRQILNTYAFEVALCGIQTSTEIQDVREPPSLR